MLKKRKEHRAVGIAASICAVILFGLILNPVTKKEESVEAITDLTGDPAITITSSKNSASVAINPSIVGAFSTTSGSSDISFSVSTSNYTGYALSVRSTKTTLDSGTNSFNSLASGVTAEQFSNASNTPLNNRWGFKPNYYNSESNNKYYGATTSNVILDRTGTANSTAKNYTISLGARADTSLPSGSYINESLILEATANVVPSSILTINYGTGITGVTIGGVNVANGETVKLAQGATYAINATFDQTLYEFNSWIATSGTIGSSSAQSTIYTIGTTDATLIVSATFNGTYMQNLNADACTTTASTVYDSRDMHAYTIQRLNDGSCWMMENLDLGRTTLTTNLTSSNTNLSATITASTFNSWKTTAGTDSYVDGQFITLSGTDSTSGTAYGTLYNYYTASAGTISGSSNNSNATYDICPAGWRLPTGGETGDFYRLYNSGYDYNTLRTPIISGGAQFALAGYFYAGAPTGAESSGRYWSSTPYNSTSFLGMHFYNGAVYPTMWNFHYFARNKVGASIRCILKESRTITKLKYLQTFKYFSSGEMAEVLASMVNNTTYNLTDMRDNRVYAVAKLKDGRIWMAENLDLGRTTLTTNLTSANTNIATTVTAATFNGWKKTSGTGTYNAGEFINVTGTDSTSGTPYGTLYNYYAASAGTISGSSNSSNAAYDICPAGWRLPIGGSSGEFQALYAKGSMRAPIANGGAAFALAGYFYNSTPTDQGSSGDYWSSTRDGNTSMYRLSLYTSGVYPAGSGIRSDGHAIRCVVKKPSHTITVIYGTGIAQISINGNNIANNSSITFEEGTSQTISASTKASYSFGNWSTTSGTIGSITGQSTTYLVGTNDATITATAIFNPPDIQNLASSSCTATASSAKDTRDGHIYTIQRLADGNCWMMENLDLGRTDLTTNLTSANTNLSTTVTAATFNSWKKTSGTGTYDAGEFIPLTAQNSDNGLDTDITSGTPYGTLYNYYAASAGTITGNSNANHAQYDICPAGWRLPTGGEYGEFQTLYQQYNSSASMRAPIANGGAAFTLAGRFKDSVPYDQNANGSYWSSSAFDSTGRKILYSNSAWIDPISSYYNRYMASSIRCVLKDLSVTYLQDFNSLSTNDKTSIIASMAENTTYSLIDNRDNRSYKIAKLKDGKVWMAENLDLGRTTLSTNLTSANTNLSTTVTAATFNSWKKTSGTGTYDAGEFIPLTAQNSDNGLDTDITSGTPYGTLYNYYAASAGTITGNSNANHAQYDICPAGWRLPTGGEYGEFQTLYQQYNSSASMRAPIANGGAAFTLAGRFKDSVPYDQNANGSYWSSSAFDSTGRKILYSNSAWIDPISSYYNRYMASSIRCVAK